MKLAIILGTRPEIIKFSPIIREAERRNIEYLIIHSNQHYSYEMDEIFFKELSLRKPDHNLRIGSGTHAQQTLSTLLPLETILPCEKPDIVLVQGDTNTALAGSLATSKTRFPLAHVEAGLRSFDRRMPEETNRIIADHLSDYLFPPTETAMNNLREEGIGRRPLLRENGMTEIKIKITGNTSVDATLQNSTLAEKSNYLEKQGLSKKQFILATAHRAENVDHPSFLPKLLKSLEILSDQLSLPVFYPMHPRSREIAKRNGYLVNSRKVILSEPVGYLEFLCLEKNARLILTDSGGVQEEACTLGIPAVVLRKSSDRPEAIESGAAVLADPEEESLIPACNKMLLAKNWKNPLGQGNAAEKILDCLEGKD
ncbi:UDP-N-acetylglucosamine 2-epimerase [Candidatus Micrarchaeota archaeon CG1_02_51_15]|nr:MAG: UDP-N-acetylglucosamine 2-epimerase [Candidatus Micrarchaeota archaeon CG1_02_51_15]